ncbi:hypothetical protein D6C80_02295 [Aureobasidium pullulans]|nr:hypothetical protein D6C80_02295 [Aureobasidium pullulans]
MADIFSSHPYPGRKNIQPANYSCGPCEKTFASKDRAAHDRSKGHRLALAKIKAVVEAAEALRNGYPVENNENIDPNACHNCGELGHMSKECTAPKKMTGACFNCGQTGHNKSDCPNPTVVTCRNCNTQGHMSRECPEPRSAVNVTCNNCDQLGHFSRDCRAAKNWSKVICNQCGLSGHTVRRCKTDPADYVIKEDAGFGDDGTAGPSGSDDWMNSGAAATTSEPAAVEGHWMNAADSTTAATSTGEEWGAAPAAAAAEW